MRWTTARVLGLVVTASVIGYLVGPTAAQAAASLVKVTAGTGPKQLGIASGRALVDTEAGTAANCLGGGTNCLETIGLNFTVPNGGDVIATGTGNATICNAFAVVDGVVVDRPSGGGATTVTITGDTDRNNTGGDLLWQGTVEGTGHLNDSFDGAVFTGKPVAVTASDANATWIVYGSCLSTLSSSQAQRLIGSHG